jgi:peptidoglycan/LPS O-acetylase OafA/YrhL
MKTYIPSLNGLRALSICLVIIGHTYFRFYGMVDLPFPLSFFLNASLGVNVFFVISGFLITRLLLQEEAANDGAVSLGKFYLRRIFRIFPAYYFLLFVYLILQMCSVLYFSRSSWLSSLFYYKYVGGRGYLDWESGHFWSLSVEEHFYLVWPFVFKYFKKWRVYFSFLVILAVIFFRLNSYYTFLHNPYLKDTISIFQRGDSIMVGCLFALFQDKLTARIMKYSGSFLNPWVLFALLILLTSTSLSDWNVKYHLHLGIIMIPFGIGNPNGIITDILIAILLIVSINRPGAWFNFLNTPAMNYIGKLSYSLYLWQELFLGNHVGIFGLFPVDLICIFIAANFSYYVIEKPFLRMKERFEMKKIPVRTPLAA